MDQRQFHSLVEEMVNFSRDRDIHPVQSVQRRPIINSHDYSKRLATYFPAKVSFNTKWNFADDDESTWEFSAPVASSSRSSSCSTSSTSSSSPAQQIVICYRAGLPLDFLATRSSSPSDCLDSGEIAPLETVSTYSAYPSVAAEKELKAVYRQSQLDALEDTREEAMAVMEKYGLGEHDSLVCHRPGCRDTLRDVKALMFHLHIHNIHDQKPQCTTCGQQHENHLCSRRQSRFRSPPASPIKESFLRIIGKISRHK